MSKEKRFEKKIEYYLQVACSAWNNTLYTVLTRELSVPAFARRQPRLHAHTTPPPTHPMEKIKGNVAVTQGGAGYNKLARPDEFISTSNSQHETSAIPPRHSIKRKLADAEPPTASSDGEPYIKRTRPDSLPPSQELDNASTPSSKNSGVEVKSSGNYSKLQHQPIRPLDHTFGQRRQLPGLDDEEGEFSDSSTNEALTYLRNVR